MIGSRQIKSIFKKLKSSSRILATVRVKKTLLFSTLAFLIIVTAILSLLVAAYDLQKPVKINASSVNVSVGKKEVARLIGRYSEEKKIATVLGSQVPYEVKKEWPAKKADFPFNAIAPSWEIEVLEGADVRIEVRVSKDGENWTKWKVVEEDPDGNVKDGDSPSLTYGALIIAEGSYFQERAVFKTNSLENIPQIKRLKLTYIDSKEKQNLLEQILRRLKSTIQDATAASNVPKRPTEEPSACSRSCWGADPSLMKWSPYNYPVEKMVLHHTVTKNADTNPKATIRAVYYYHAVVRGWGDIGYNFVVDWQGNIYEGRYGGDGVAGAHALGYNVGSVGVGVLGDFRYASLSNKIRNALHKIAVWKFYTHQIDPDKATSFGNPSRKLPAIIYHAQVANTACAGRYINNWTPSLKKLAHYMPQQIVFRDSESVKKIGSSSKYVSDLLDSYKDKGTVAPNYIRKVAAFPDDGVTPPNDTNYSSQWELPKLDALNVWKESTGGLSSVKVAVVDTGVAYEDYNPAGSENYAKAPDFASTNFVAGYDYVNSDSHPNDDEGHGTVVASIIAESTNNSIGSASLAYGTSIMPIKVCDSDGWCLDSEVAKGIRFARINGAKVINMSIGGDDYSSVVQAEINSAWDSGLIIAAASGNEYSNKVSYPARGGHVIGVGALTSSDTRAAYSNYGTGLDVMAPGGNAGGGSGDLLYQMVNCTAGLDCTNFTYGRVAGTSIATPLAAASAALLVGKGTIWPDSAARYLMIKSLDLGSAGKDSVYGWGRIRPFNSMQLASSEKPHPNGTLMRAVGKTTIYVIDGGQKRKIPSPGVFLSRFNPKLITSVSSYEVGTYPDGSNVTFNDGVLLKGSSTALYVLADGKKRWIRSPRTFHGLGYESEDVTTVSDGTLSVYSNGPDVHSSAIHPNGSLIRAAGATSIYLIDGGQKRKIPTPAVLISGFNRKYILETTGAKVASYPTGSSIVHNDSSILRAVGGTTIYVLSDGEKRRISHPITFSDLGYKSENITRVSAPYLDSFSNGDSVI